MSAWLLYFWFWSYHGGAVAIPGIASEAECHRLAAEIAKFEMTSWTSKHHCVEYKVVDGRK